MSRRIPRLPVPDSACGGGPTVSTSTMTGRSRSSTTRPARGHRTRRPEPFRRNWRWKARWLPAARLKASRQARLPVFFMSACGRAVPSGSMTSPPGRIFQPQTLPRRPMANLPNTSPPLRSRKRLMFPSERRFPIKAIPAITIIWHGSGNGPSGPRKTGRANEPPGKRQHRDSG